MDIGRLVASIGADRTAAQRAAIATPLIFGFNSAARARSRIDRAYRVNRTTEATQRRFNSRAEAGKHAVGDSAGAIPCLCRHV
jgi:hypothetical protein